MKFFVCIVGVMLLVWYAIRLREPIVSCDEYELPPAVEAESAIERVTLYIRDYHHWWKATNRAVPPLNLMKSFHQIQHESVQQKLSTQTDKLQEWLRHESSIVRRHFTPDYADAFQSGGFSWQASHSPHEERIIKVTEVSDEFVLVETRLSFDGGPEWNEYEVRFVNGEWRIQDMLNYLDDAGVMISTTVEREALFKQIRNSVEFESLPSDELERCERVFVEKAFEIDDGPVGEIKVVDAGEIDFSSGYIGLHDFGWLKYEFRPLAVSVSPGVYPLQLAEFTSSEGDVRNAAARVLFGDVNTVATWTTANTTDGGNVIGVDAGNVAIFDAEAALRLEARACERLYSKNITKRFHKEYSKQYVEFPLHSNESKINCYMIDSGWGDGAYPCYWGLNREGAPVVLLIDFGLFDLPDVESAN